MLKAVTIFCLIYCAVNWGLFVWSIYAGSRHAHPPHEAHRAELRAVDVDKIVSSTGKLAGAFKSAGVPATAAALSLVALILAAVSAGLGKL